MRWVSFFFLALGCKGDKNPSNTSQDTTSTPGDTDSGRPDTVDTTPPGDDTDSGPHESADPCATLTAVAAPSRSSGRIPLEVDLDASGSCGPDAITSWHWEIGGEALDGALVSWTGLSAGAVDARLTVTDEAGNSATDTLSLEVLPQECPEVLDAVELGAVADAELVEASGLVVSRRDPDVLWTHNDSGDTPRLFALGRDGSALGTWTLDVDLGDWEDLAWGADPDTGEPLLFIGDVGSFGTSRETVLVYVIEEPEVDTAAAPSEHAVESWRTLTLRLPEVLNIDSMLVDPDTGDLLLISDAEDGRSVLLRKPAPHTDGEDVSVEAVGELSFGTGSLTGDVLATGADISPLGERVVVRTRDEAWLWLRDGSQSVAEALLDEPCAVALPTQELGETIAFDIRDGGLLTVGEGSAQPLYWVPFTEEPECADTLDAVITATPAGGPLPLTVAFDASDSCVPAGLARARWDIDGEVHLGTTASMTWYASGSYPVSLLITDTLGAIAVATTTIEVEAGDCPVEDGLETLGTVADEELVETSGIVVSRIDPEVLWVHDDEGDPIRLYALSRAGETLGTWTLDVSGDIEDMAATYAEDGTAEIWIGNIGDNAEAKSNITIYRIDEPEVPDGEAGEHEVTDYDAITLTYPDGARNSETLMVDPLTRDLYVVTKDDDGYSDVYRKPAPHTDGESAELEHVASLAFGTGDLAGNQMTTGGDWSPDGAWIVIRTYANTAYVWRRDRSGTADEAFATDPCPVRIASELQGEAICFDSDGAALLTVSERASQPIYRVPLTR